MNMTNQEILKKAIEKAVKNGYQGIHLIEYANSVDGHLGDLAKFGLICTKDFAKAFWGTDLTNYDGDHPDEEWQYRLQQMVLEEDPIKYLEQFI